MKHVKKLVSLMLALVMVLAMGVTAFAQESKGTITVDNPQADQTYTAYKIFDVVYSEDKDAYSYTISGDSEWFGVVATKDNESNEVTSRITGLTFQKAFGENTYIVSKVDGFSAASFANTLKENVNGKKGTQLADSEGKVTASNLELGYYFVTSSTGALCNLTTTDPSVTIHDKNDVPFDKTEDKTSVEVGEVVNYTIDGKVPDYTGFETYIYQIADTMSDGLTFNNDVKVYINGTELTENFILKTGVDAGEKAFVLDIDVMKLTIGAKIEVKYTATVNENAVAKIEKNKATLTYSNDPTDSNKTKTQTDEEKVYSAKIVIDKYAKDDKKKLEGAKFVLMNKDGKYYKYTESTATEKAKVEWVDKEEDSTEVITDKNGAGNFDGLKDGTYYLKEIAAPAGYNLLTNRVEITINGEDATETALDSLTVTAEVENNTGSELPSTGGMGTTIFYVLGTILLLGSAVLLITRRRMNAEK